MKSKVRLQKYLASCGVASRRKCEEFIKDGRVKVNGEKIIKLGTSVLSNDVVEFDGKIMYPEAKIYFVLNKPPYYLCSRNDKWKRNRVFDIIDTKTKSLRYVGRLDFLSQGLLILTNDGDFINEIIHPSKRILKSYLVESASEPPQKMIEDFRKGIKIDGVFYKAHQIKLGRKRNLLKIYLFEGKKREIRVVYNEYSVKIEKLTRNSIGHLKLDKLGIKVGSYKQYSLGELREAIYGKKIGKQNYDK